jgi:uncharacterized protein
MECRRCLGPVEVPVDESMDLLFVPMSESGVEEDEGARPLPQEGAELDVSEAFWEEMILSQSPFAVCSPDCRGLCPHCGVNLNEEVCQCSREESDFRWGALQALKDKQE